MRTIAIDQDQVLADLMTSWLELYNKDYEDNLKSEDIRGWNISEYVKKECGTKIFSYLDDYGLFRNLSVVENSQSVVKELSKHYRVFVTTSATSYTNALVAKVEWLREHFDFIPRENIVLCGNKSIINADIMIDDGIHNLEAFMGTGRILFSAPHNLHEKRFCRANGWKDVGKIFL
jgi:5'-nucleotidase